MAEAKLQVIPLGGLGEFGMNCLALRYGDDIIVIDAGMMFPDAELMGVDSVVPDFSYLTDNREHVRGLVLTHGHEDHIGGIPFLLSELDIPVYGTAFTIGLVERRLDEHEMLGDTNLNVVEMGQRVKLGCFTVEFIQVTHSIVQAAALAITTPLGVVIHTGDFKVDPTPTDNLPFDLHAFADYGKRGVLLLLSDSTNADRPGYTESERAVFPRLEEIFSRAPNRIVVSCFSSSIHRIQQLLDLAKAHRRKVAIL
ncbi:MAG: ribonuclease J, partial [Bryobacterales bacterium]|nr:ribonuclease J [Bryobacterales bacterium]